MTALAPTLEAFFTERLARQREASIHTVAAYRDSLRLLVNFAHAQTGKVPSKLDLADLGAPVIGKFLDYLEKERCNSVRSRNARLAAIHSLFRFASFRHPEHAGLIQRVLAIPQKRFDRALVAFLTAVEIRALLAAPDRASWIGRRDHTLLLVAVQTGLRVSELTRLACEDVHLGVGPYVRCRGKGRKERCVPLTANTVDVLRVWMHERHGQFSDLLLPTRSGRPLSSDAVEHLLSKYVARAAQGCPSLRGKHITPHMLRHTCAMQLLEAGVDTSVIALWLGHEEVETTQIYLHADLALKERALARTTPPDITPGRYRASDPLLKFLDGL
jgi:integrase/recombinase XerD